jgi:hypothetical protein
VIFLLLQFRVYQDYQMRRDQSWQQYHQAMSAHNMVVEQYRHGEQQKKQHQQHQEEIEQWQEWIDISRRPEHVMRLIQLSLPSGVYLDRLLLIGRELTVQGVVHHEQDAARFAHTLDNQVDVGQVYRMRLDSVQPRWQRSFHPFDLRVELSLKANE